MFGFSQIEFTLVGAAAVVDTVLLLALTRRRNLRYVSVPIMLLVLGAWLWHAGAFVHLLIEDLNSSLIIPLQWMAMMAMTAGLILMPSAMLHGFWRMETTGLQPLATHRTRYSLAYLPLVLLAPAGMLIAAEPLAPYMKIMQGWKSAYAIWVTFANCAAAIGLYRLRSRVETSIERRFAGHMSLALVLLMLVQSFCLFFAYEAWPAWQSSILLVVVLSPLIPAVLFAYFVIRFNFMRLVLEQSILYGAVLAGALLVHRLLAGSLGPLLQERYQLDISVLEVLLLFGIVLIYPPLRRRSAEALRYLMGTRADVMRQQTQRLSSELSVLSGQPPRDVIVWFTAAARDAFGVRWAAVWLFDDANTAWAKGTTPDGCELHLPAEGPWSLFEELSSQGWSACTQRDVPSQAVLELLHKADAGLAVLVAHRGIRGLLMLGRRRGHRDLADEETSAIILLAEQLAITLNSGLLQAERLAAERRALQSEKLSTLGLLASSIAHEVKNPLSSIKTIATVMSEQLGAESPHAEDLRLILEEIDRLSRTTSQLLQFARPANAGDEPSHVEPILSGTMQVMRHLARQRGVQLQFENPTPLPPVRAEENAIREIFFNLLSNAIEAAGDGGSVTIDCRQENGHVITRFHDSGPGISPADQDQLFQPFFTTKHAGTGLGLYVTNRRVRECGGAIVCDSGPEHGTCFTVKLPCAEAGAAPTLNGADPDRP